MAKQSSPTRRLTGAARPSPLLNFSTKVAVDRTLGEIHALLRAHKARTVTTEFDEANQACAVFFRYMTEFGEREFRLPVGVEAVHRVLLEKIESGEIDVYGARERFTSSEHAAEVAWRIVKDWLEAQLAILQSRQVSLEQIMLPYMLSAGGVTVYEALKTNELKALREGRR